jgi:hypothetical protein
MFTWPGVSGGDGFRHGDRWLTVTFPVQGKAPRRFTDATGAVREVPVNLLTDPTAATQKTQTHEGQNQLDFVLPGEKATAARVHQR